MPNSVLSKQKETTGSADTQCCSVLKQTCGLFGKPVINWQHYLQIQILAQKITSWQTWVLMYISKFSLLNESWWKEGSLTGMFSFASYFVEPFSSIYHLFFIFWAPNTPITLLLFSHFVFFLLGNHVLVFS